MADEPRGGQEDERGRDRYQVDDEGGGRERSGGIPSFGEPLDGAAGRERPGCGVPAPREPSSGSTSLDPVPNEGEIRYRERCLAKTGVRFRGDERLLDAGCGDGGVARLLRPRVAEVVAVDVVPSPAWRAEPGLSFAVADAAKLPFPDAGFDVVHSKDSLHHMEDPRAALAEYARVLRPGGTLLVIEGNRYNPVFYVHMTRALGHEHFTRADFRGLVSERFPEARFGSFEAHYVPWAGRLLPLQRLVEDVLERVPGLDPLLSYNFAVART